MDNFTQKWMILLFLFAITCSYVNAQEKPYVKDDPIERVKYETRRLLNPASGKVPDNIRELELDFAKQIPVKKNLNVTEWQHRGPFNVGGRTRALAIDRANENIILAGGVSGGLWRSDDSGSSWTKVTSPNDLQSITAIAQDPDSTDIWYYVTGEKIGNSASGQGASYLGDGVFKSTDNGLSWSKLESTSSNTPEKFDKLFDYCWNVKVDLNHNVFVASYGGIWRSVDGGISWDIIFNSGDPNYNYSNYTDIALASDSTIYIATSSDGDKSGFYKSTDSGENWTDITPVGFPDSYKRTVISVAPGDSVVYFLTYVSAGANDSSIHNLWRYEYHKSTNDYSWTDLSSNIPAQGDLTGNFDSQGGYDLLIKVKPDDESTIIMGGTNLWRSTDGFTTSDNITKIGGYVPTNDSYALYEHLHSDQHALVFYYSDPNKVISGNDGGLSITTDVTKETVDNPKTNPEETVVWNSLNAGYLTTQAYSVAMDMNNPKIPYVMAGFQDNGTWMSSKESSDTEWDAVDSGDGSYCAIVNDGNEYFTSSQNGTIYRSWYDSNIDDWNWTRVDPDGATDQDFINPFIIDPNDSKVMYYPGGDVIWRNSDLTEISSGSSDPATTNWSKITQTQVNDWVSILDVSTMPSNVLYYGTYSGKLYKVINADKSTAERIDITGDNFPLNGVVSSIKVNPQDTSEIIVCFSNYEVISIWHTSDGGSTWESVSGNLEENSDGSGNGPSVRWVEMLIKNDGNKVYFAGTSTGLYTTTSLDGDNTVWSQESPDLIGNVVVDMIKIRSDGLVAIATHGNGIYTAMYGDEIPQGINETPEVSIAEIYPNPTNGVFSIDVESEKPADYRIIVYNITGQAVFFSERRNISSFVQQVDLSKHSKGVYTIEVIKGSKSYPYKVLLK